MNIIVVDASVGVKWFVSEKNSENAKSILIENNQLHAPEFFLVEVNSVFSKKIKAHELIKSEADDARIQLDNFPIEYHSTRNIINRAFDLSLEIPHRIYDCLYLSLAIHLEALMVTADEEFYAKLQSTKYSACVKLIQNYS